MKDTAGAGLLSVLPLAPAVPQQKDGTMSLSYHQALVLKLLLHNIDKVVPTEIIYAYVTGGKMSEHSWHLRIRQQNMIAGLIHALRKAGYTIKSVHGVGYGIEKKVGMPEAKV